MPTVEMRGIVKRFGGFTANDHIDFAVKQGEIRALVGENGAGKTTLMRILFGLLRPEEGTIALRGQVVDFHSPRDAIAKGVGMVHQHFMLFNDLSVAENVVYGREPKRLGVFVDQERAEQEVSELAQRYGFQVDPAARLGTLSVGERQRVEIFKILYRGANVLIFDEPTAVLTPQERDELFAVINTLADQGKVIILITHKLKEVMAESHTATVLRRGKVTGNVITADSSPEEIARLMVGRDVLMHIDRPPAQTGDNILTVESLTYSGGGPKPLLDNVSFDIRSGEIVGIAGVAGNGQSELVDLLVGFKKADNGNIKLNGEDVTWDSIEKRRKQGLAYIPEDRYQRGLAVESSVAENLAMGFHREMPIAKNGILNLAEMRRWALNLSGEFDIRISDPREAAQNLSGGNLQKLVVAREFSQKSHFILADQPTRGVDITSTEFIHRKLIERRNAGDAVLLISADLDEIMSLSDRILVMAEGCIVAERQSGSVDENELGLLMTSGADHAASQPNQGLSVTDE